MELFSDAQGLLTPVSHCNEFKMALLRHGKFNIQLLSLSDVGVLLAKKNYEIEANTSEFDTWLQKFWGYWRDKEPLHLLGEKSSRAAFTSFQGIHNYTIFKDT